MLREAASSTRIITGEVIPANNPGTQAMAQRKPLDVCLGIAPWNAPIILGVRAVATALACGNTVILKASELCPATQRTIGQVFQDAGSTPGVVNMLTNAPEDAPEVKHANFTGSTSAGRIIGERAVRNLTPAILEFGGKNPMEVLDDADRNAAVNGAAFGVFVNRGQIGISTERVIVQEGIADKFIAALAAKTRALPAGNPRKEVVLGSLVTNAAAEKMAALIKDAKAKGESVMVRSASYVF